MPRELTEEQAVLLRLLARQVVGRIELTRHIALQNKLMEDRDRLLGEVRQAAEEREQDEARQRLILGDVLSSVTGGRLRLCQSPDDLPVPLEHAGKWVALSVPED